MHNNLLDKPRPILQTEIAADFSNNLRELEKRSKRPYSLANVLRIACSPSDRDKARLEIEVDQELRTLNPHCKPMGMLVPMSAFTPTGFQRDLSVGGSTTGAALVQTSVVPEVLPFLRAKSVCGRP